MNLPENNNLDRDSSEYSDEWLSAYIDDELTETQRALVEQRLASDSEARQMLGDLQRVRGLVNQLSGWSGKLASPAETPLDRQPSMDAGESNRGDSNLEDSNLEDSNLEEGQAAECNANIGDYHDELQRSPEHSLHSETPESISEALDQQRLPADIHANSPPNITSPTSRLHIGRRLVSARSPYASWMRPLALAAGLLLMVGGGAWLWNSGPSWTVATSTDVGRAAPHSASGGSAASQLKMNKEGKEGADESPQSLAVEVDANSRSAAEEMQPRAAEKTLNFSSAPPLPATAAPIVSDALGRQPTPQVSDGPAEISAAKIPGLERESMSHGFAPPVAMDSLEENSASAARDAVTELRQSRSARGLNEQNSPSAPPMSTAPMHVQLAHSAGWSAAEIEAALQRLAPLLNLPPARATDPALTNTAAAIPVAVISQNPLQDQGLSLHDRLRQQPIALQEVVASDAQPFAWQTPLGQAPPDKPSTVALFVLRDEADQILQAVQATNESSSKPVWITAASGTPAPASPKQQVVLLFAPQ